MEEKVFRAEGPERSKACGERKQVGCPDADAFRVVTLGTSWDCASLPPEGRHAHTTRSCQWNVCRSECHWEPQEPV